jgi:predicted nuclease with TOPRIM domain
MSIPRDQILQKLGEKMLAEIDLLLRRFAEEKAGLLQASARLQAIDAEVSVLEEERARLIARGERLTVKEDSLNDTRTGTRSTTTTR